MAFGKKLTIKRIIFKDDNILLLAFGYMLVSFLKFGELIDSQQNRFFAKEIFYFIPLWRQTKNSEI
jgi:hypothetical protein